MAGSRISKAAPPKPPSPLGGRSWLTLVPLLLWGSLLLHYWRSGDLNLLIHPVYHGLTLVTGLILIILPLGQLLLGWSDQAQDTARSPRLGASSVLHPPQWAAIVLLSVIALAGFWVPLRVFASSVASDRQVADFLTINRREPEAFRLSVKSEDRTLVDWVKTLNVYPEPDAYQGQAVKVEGFVLHPPDLPENYILLARFVITCCAADVYPVGLPLRIDATGPTIKTPGNDRSAYPIDHWFSVQGTMTTDTLNNQRKLVIQPTEITAIPEPDQPYEF